VWSKLLSTLKGIASPALKELVLVSLMVGGTDAHPSHLGVERPNVRLLPSGAHQGRQWFEGSSSSFGSLAVFFF